MRTITSVCAYDNWTLDVAFSDGEQRRFDLKPFLSDEAFEELADILAFKRVANHGYFVEWDSGADLSADTLFHLGTPSDRASDRKFEQRGVTGERS